MKKVYSLHQLETKIEKKNTLSLIKSNGINQVLALSW